MYIVSIVQDNYKKYTASCPLCDGKGDFFQKHEGRFFYLCRKCCGVFLDRKHYPDLDAEKKRYMEHNNDVEDIRYQEFVSPIVQSVLFDFTPQHQGMDFGAGTGPVISKLLQDKGYDIVQYDPFFYDEPQLLQKKYDYIACCEVIEHFHYPYREFNRLKNLLEPRGRLYCMTEMFYPEMDFQRWYYKTDPTHVFFYQKKTFSWIKEHVGFNDFQIKGRLIIMYN